MDLSRSAIARVESRFFFRAVLRTKSCCRTEACGLRKALVERIPAELPRLLPPSTGPRRGYRVVRVNAAPRGTNAPNRLHVFNLCRRLLCDGNRRRRLRRLGYRRALAASLRQRPTSQGQEKKSAIDTL